MTEKKKRLLMTGVSGLLGSNLAYCLKDTYDITGIYHTHPFAMDGIRTRCADLTSGERVASLLDEVDPDVVVHCAAQADVDICEEGPEEARRKNVVATEVLVDCLKGRRGKLVFVSTDLVYDGVKGDYAEYDPVNPPNGYGRTKREAEQAALSREDTLVLRTNFFGWNFLNKYSLGEWAIHELSQGHRVKGFTDCRFSGIYTFEFAKLLDAAITKGLSGIYHLASSTSATKFEFANFIAGRMNLDGSLIRPTSIDDFGFKAQRSKNLSLKTDKLARDLGCDVPSMHLSIERFIRDFNKGIPQIIKACVASKDGYPVVSDLIPYGCQYLDEEDIRAVVDVLKSRSLTQGPKIREFESALCAATDAAYGVALNSGTSGLHIACLAAGVGPGDEVITSPNSFVASANCAVYCGGKPVFADIDPRTYNISPESIEEKINERTKAVIPVHFAGQSSDMETVQGIVRAAAKKYGHKIFLIEDASHALGSVYKGSKVGSCAYSDMAVFSFHPVKHITTGEGGAVLTNDKKLRRQLSYYRSHGITSTPEELVDREGGFMQDEATGASGEKNPWYYEQNCLGYNYRITDIQCALGISQLKKLNVFRQRRRVIVDQYNKAFKDVPWLTVPFEEPRCDSNFHLYVLQFDFNTMGTTRAKTMIVLKEKGIQTQVHYIPVHTQPFYRNTFGTKWGDCPRAERYYQGCLSVPLHPSMTDEDVAKVVETVRALAPLDGSHVGTLNGIQG